MIFSAALFGRGTLTKTELERRALGTLATEATTKASLMEPQTLGKQLGHTVGGRNPAPAKKPWNIDSPLNTNNARFPMDSEGAEFRPPTVSPTFSEVLSF